MKRRLYTAFATAMLVGASLEAPFAHVHPGDPDHHHAQGLVHDHLAVHEHHSFEHLDAVEGPEIEPQDADELAIFLDSAPTAAQRFAVTYMEGPPALTVAPVILPSGVAPELTPRSHGPPAVRLLPARAPPL